jgi:hypothetical protein
VIVLASAVGEPEDIARSDSKAKSSETWKYWRIGKNRYRKKVLLENGIVGGLETLGEGFEGDCDQES